MNNKRKLLNALRMRMSWFGYEFSDVSHPFDDRFCVAIQRPDKKIMTVYIDSDETDYDVIVNLIHDDPEITEIRNDPSTKIVQEGANDGE